MEWEGAPWGRPPAQLLPAYCGLLTSGPPGCDPPGPVDAPLTGTFLGGRGWGFSSGLAWCFLLWCFTFWTAEVVVAASAQTIDDPAKTTAVNKTAKERFIFSTSLI